MISMKARTCCLIPMLALAVHSASAQDDPRRGIVDAKMRVIDAAYRNDGQELERQVAVLDSLAPREPVASHALYYGAWAEWMLAAVHLTAGDTIAASSVLAKADARAERLVGNDPSSGEAHALRTWILVAITSADPARRSTLGPRITEHRRRALELAPRSPRVIIMDAGLTFYTPARFGGSQSAGIARWLEAMSVFATEGPDTGLEPRWGHAFAHGWLANMYLASTPPDPESARRSVDAALALRPDFWFAANVVRPRMQR